MPDTTWGLWTVIASAEPKLSGRTRVRKLRQWLCRCDCGTERKVLEKGLKTSGRSAFMGAFISLIDAVIRLDVGLTVRSRLAE